MALLGLVNKKERWGLSWRGWLLGVSGGLLVAIVLGLTLQPFLALNQPVGRGLLVVEGWMPEYALTKAVELHKENVYEHIVTTGMTIPEGSILESYGTAADLCKTRLMLLGLPDDAVTAIPSPIINRDRTYAMGLSVRDWLNAHQGEGHAYKALDVLTLDIHSRRSRMMYQVAVGADIEVGVISIDNKEYDHSRWWASSYGVKGMISESLSYLYTVLIFKENPKLIEEFLEKNK